MHPSAAHTSTVNTEHNGTMRGRAKAQVALR